jgi:hypothetical protein
MPSKKELAAQLDKVEARVYTLEADVGDFRACMYCGIVSPRQEMVVVRRCIQWKVPSPDLGFYAHKDCERAAHGFKGCPACKGTGAVPIKPEKPKKAKKFDHPRVSLNPEGKA